MKIDIKIKNNKDFGDIALLIDKPQFLEAIKMLREKWNIIAPLPLRKLKNFQGNLFDKNKLQEFEIDIRDLRIKFNKPDTFDKVMSYSIICGVIPNGIYKSTYYGIAGSPPSRLEDRTSRVAIFVTPQSQNDDVSEALREIRKNIFKNREDGYNVFFSIYSKDEVSNIKRDRRWYWKNLNGKSYRDIAIEENKARISYSEAKKAEKHIKDFSDKKTKEYLSNLRYIDNYAETIRKALKRYRKALSAT